MTYSIEFRRKVHPPRRRKIDKAKLRAHIHAEPDMLLRERAQIFNVSITSLSVAMRKLGFRKKKNENTWSETI